MSLADELLNDLDGLSDGDEAPEQTSEHAASTSKVGDMGPPALPSDRKRKAEIEARNDDDEDDDLDNALGGTGEADSPNEGEDGDEASTTMKDGSSATGYVGAGGTRPADELDREEVEGMDLKDVDDVESVVKLHRSRKLLDTLQVGQKGQRSSRLPRTDSIISFLLQRIEYYTANPEDTSVEAGPVEENPEYALIVQSNNLSVEVENELLLVHKVGTDDDLHSSLACIEANCI